ncbi:hypothetical protein [Demequina oxidasica]|uniref:hypothetical protein n=1 Tax=Demequina oxidasica TaxID=676199 RepID=UPI0007820B23|nr:hypothetical protein [Demequina oxidasica]
MIINEVLIVVVVAVASWWLVRSIAHLRDPDIGRNGRLDVEASALLLVLGISGVALSFNLAVQILGGVALLVGLGAGYALVRRRSS